MKLKPEDFEGILIPCNDPNNVRPEEVLGHFIKIANIKIQEWLEGEPTVYGNGKNLFDASDKEILNYFDWNEQFDDECDTHKAKLVKIELV